MPRLSGPTLYRRKKSRQPWVNEAISFDVQLLDLVASGVRIPDVLASKLKCDVRKVHAKARQYIAEGILEKFNDKLYLAPTND